VPDLLERLKSALADRYAVESEIGRGGMAVVFLAEDLKHHRKVAIKVLHPELAAAVGAKRFAHEIEIVGGLTHPHILPLHDSGEADGLLFCVMPYVEGENLRQLLEREKQLPIDQATRIAREVADALDHSHQRGIVHRDIKPANILLEGGHAVVTDFGVARAVSEAGAERVTATGMAVGTPAYMSPEQASGEKVDERSDIYAVGCVLYEMLAGEPPLTGATPQSTAAKRLTDRPTPLGAIRSTIPSGLQSLVERTLATAPVDRPATARQLVAELEEASRLPEPAVPGSRTAGWLVPLAAVAVAALALIVILIGNRSSRRPAYLGPHSIAVLPLVNNTGEASFDGHRVALATMLTTGLAQLDELTVVGVQRLIDLMRQAGHEDPGPIPEGLAFSVATGSGAQTLAYGSFVKVGDDIRVDVQLIDLASGTTTGAEQVRGPDPFMLMDSLSARLSTRVLGRGVDPTRLKPIAQLTTTGSLDAYREYQDGLLAEARVLRAEAKEHYQRATELDSTFARAWMRLGMLAVRDGDYESASGHLERAERNSTGASANDRLMIQAGVAQVDRRWDESIDLLEELLSRDPYDKEARYHLGLTLRLRGRWDDSRRVLEEVLALDPYHPGAINDLAYNAMHLGDESRADSLSRRFIELEPDQWNPYDTRAEILDRFGRYEEAREMDREAIRRNPTYPTPYNRLSMSYLGKGDPAGAREALAALSDTREGAVYEAWFGVDTYVFEGRYRDAYESQRLAMQRARELGRDHFLNAGFDLYTLVLGETGIHANAVGAYAEAEASFEELDRIEDMNPWALFGILGCYGEQRRFEEMSRVRDSTVADLESAPDVGRRRAEALAHYASGLLAWYRDGDAEETVRLFEQGHAARGINRYFLRPSMGVQGEEVLAFIGIGQALDALAIITEMEEAADQGSYRLLSHAAWYLRGRAYEALEEPEQALESYHRLLDVAGDRVREVVLFRDTPERVARLSGAL
jgi:serine/threonine-protein kinase